MRSVRLRALAIGGALALVTGLLVDHGSFLGSDFPRMALFGIAVGAVLGLVPDRTLAARLGGFLAGFAAAWLGYAARAGFLPDIPLGRALAAAGVVVVVTGVTVISNGRAPLWSGLLGVATLVGAYEAAFDARPTAFLTESVVALTTVLAAAGFGLLTATLAEDATAVDEAVAHQHGEVVVPTPRAAEPEITREVAR